MDELPGFVIASTDALERITGRGTAYPRELFGAELRQLRTLYVQTGNPSLAHRFGQPMSVLASQVGGRVAEIAAYELFMAELLLASGGQPGVEAHLATALRHAETAAIAPDLRARLLAKGEFLRAVAIKAGGDTDGGLKIIGEARQSHWWYDNVAPEDEIMLERQRVMMRGSLEEHVALLAVAPSYRDTRPLEYFRTLKRVFEVFVNNGHARSAEMLRPALISAYASASSALPMISKVSLLKNLAQAAALQGAPVVARQYAVRAASEAAQLGLAGQSRQINAIIAGIDAGYVVGTLRTFLVRDRTPNT